MIIFFGVEKGESTEEEEGVWRGGEEDKYGIAKGCNRKFRIESGYVLM